MWNYVFVVVRFINYKFNYFYIQDLPYSWIFFFFLKRSSLCSIDSLSPITYTQSLLITIHSPKQANRSSKMLYSCWLEFNIFSQSLPGLRPGNFDLPDTWFFSTRPHGASRYAYISEYLAKMQKNSLFRFLELFFCKAPSFQNSAPTTTSCLSLSYPLFTFFVWLLAL